MYQDPHGALRAFGEHKGYGLAVVTELLAAALSGGPTLQPGNVRHGGTINNMLAVLIDPARLAGLDWFRREVDGFLDYVKASPPADATRPSWCRATRAAARAKRGAAVRRRRDDMGRDALRRRAGGVTRAQTTAVTEAR